MKLHSLVFILFFISTLPVTELHAQRINLINYSLGYRVFEMEDPGNNPFTISAILKDPVSYDNFIQSLRYNGYSANPGPVQLHSFYFNAEFQKVGTESRFWKKHSVQAGLLLTARQKIMVGEVSTFQYVVSPDTVVYNDSYGLTRRQQFVGLNIGLNRRFQIINRLSFIAGLHVQGTVALIHHVEQRLDSNKFTTRTGWTTKTTYLPDLKAKNYFQWQVMVPLGLEYRVYRNKLFCRLEFNAGLIGGKYRPRDLYYMQTYGAGFWLIYKR